MLYTLKNNRFTAIADSMGAELFSLKDNSNIEYLWQGDESFWTGRSPHLFPIVGAQKNDTYIKDGKEYHIPKHGFARKSDFKAISQSDSSITFELKESEETLKVYPYKFILQITHELTDTGFVTTYNVKNTNEEKMPYCVGGHVGVNCPILEGESFDDYAVDFDTDKELYSLFCPTADPIDFENSYKLGAQDGKLKLNHRLFDNDAIVLNNMGIEKLDLVHKSGHGVHFSFEGFPVIALWTMHGKDAPYLCLEPWHGLPSVKGEGDRLEDKMHAIILEPQENKELSYSLDIKL